MAGQVGNFQIQGELERTPGAVTYRALHVGLNQPVLLKVLVAGAAAAPEVRQRFVQEGTLLTRLEHPCIQRVIEVGEEAGRPYVALEPVPAQRMGALLRQRAEPLPVLAAAQIACKLAGALEHAHAGGVVHRDVALGSLLLTADGRPILTDFGYTKDLDPAVPGVAQTGRAMGTPGYSAPEQASGQMSRIGPLVDVYGLGAVLYTLLVRQTPIQGDSPMGIMARTISQQPIPPRQLRPDVPPTLEAIVLRCLAKAPEQRYASATELRVALETALGGTPPTATSGVHLVKPQGTPAPIDLENSLASRPAVPSVSAAPQGGLDLAPEPAPAFGGLDLAPEEPAPEDQGFEDDMPEHVAAMMDPRGRIEARHQPKSGPPVAILAGGALLLVLIGVGVFFAAGGMGGDEPEPRVSSRDTDDDTDEDDVDDEAVEDTEDAANDDDAASDGSGGSDSSTGTTSTRRAAKAAEATQHVDAGLEMLADGNLQGARERFDEAIALVPSALAHNARGNVFYRLKIYKRALKDFEAAIALDEEAPEPHHNRGAVAEQLGETSTAIEAYERFLALAPDHPESAGVEDDVRRLKE